MTFFFDRSIGVSIPKALRLLKLPVGIEFHQEHFPPDEHDDIWLNLVGTWGWLVVSQDYSFHLRETELEAIKQHDMGCFYLWGADAGRWATMRVFAKAYDKIVTTSGVAIRPFVYDVWKSGALHEVAI